MGTVIFLLVLASLVYIFGSGIVIIPTNHYGLQTVFNKKTETKFKEGINYTFPLFPLFGRVLLYLMEPKPEPLTTENRSAAQVISEDRFELHLEGAFQWEPDFDNLLVYAKTSFKLILNGVKVAIEEGLADIAGKFKGEIFYARRDDISRIINCKFSLERRPDYYLDWKNPDDFIKNSSESFKDYIERLLKANANNLENLKKINKLDHSNWLTPKTETGELSILDFYKDNVTRIVTMLELEKSMNEKSEIEKRYGIKITAFNLSKILYSPESMAALEDSAQVDKRMEAFDKLHKRKMEIVKELIHVGVDPNQASNDADAQLGIAPKQIISGTAIPFINTKP